MLTRTGRKVWLAGLAAGMMLPCAGCLDTETRTALADLTAETAGGVVQILVSDYLSRLTTDESSPDLGAPIAEQEE